MTSKPIKKPKALQTTFVLKNDKEKGYIYPLSNGTFLSFQSKEFPTNQNQNTNQLLLF